MRIKVNQIAKTALDDIIKIFGKEAIDAKIHCVESLNYDVTFSHATNLLLNRDDSLLLMNGSNCYTLKAEDFVTITIR